MPRRARGKGPALRAPVQGSARYLFRRFGRALIALWLISTIVFVVMRLSGDPVPLLLPPDAPRSEILRVRSELGLDRPLIVQYGVFFRRVVQGDFGRSIHFQESAMAVTLQYLPATLELALVTFLLSVVIGVPTGILAAIRHNSLYDTISMTAAFVGQSAPTFFIGIMLILVVSLQLRLLPTSGRGGLDHIILPAVTLAAFTLASIARITRASVLDVLRADFVRTARAKGLVEFWVIGKHALKNAAIPILTMSGLQFGSLLSGAVVTETIFAWPGIGRLTIQSIYNRDYPVVQATVFLTAAMFIAVNLIVDLVYATLDPRIRYE